MDDRYRGDDPRRSVRLASSADSGSARDRSPLPLGVNERTRGVGSRPMNGGGIRPSGGRAPRPEFRPPARPTGDAPVYRGPRNPRPHGPGDRSPRAADRRPRGNASSSGRAYRDAQGRSGGNPSPRPRPQGQPSHGAGRQRPLNGNYAHTPTRSHRNGHGPRAGYVGGPLRGSRGSNRIFSRPTWQTVLFSPRGIAVLLAIAVIGVGGLGINAKIQRDKAEETARIEAQKKKERLAKQRVNPNRLGPGALAISTPRSEWQAGSMPHLYQTDPAWASRPYAGSDVRTAACGPTCLAMVYIYLTGNTDLDPAGMAAFADEHNFAPTGATEWRFMTEGASMIGIRSTAISPTRASIASALEAGKPVICTVSPGDFTTTGHFIVLKSIDENGLVEVFDPNSPYNSAQRWPIARVLPQIDALWAFSA